MVPKLAAGHLDTNLAGFKFKTSNSAAPDKNAIKHQQNDQIQPRSQHNEPSRRILAFKEVEKEKPPCDLQSMQNIKSALPQLIEP